MIPEVIPTVLMPIDQVIPYDNNPRDINDDAIAAVAASIKAYGWKQDLVVDRNNVLVVGHTRLLAAKSLGLKEVPVKKAVDLSDKQAQEYRLIDNKSGEKAFWNIEKLQLEMQDLDLTQDVIMLNFTQLEQDAIFNKDWQTDLEKVEKTEPLDDLAIAKVTIEVAQADKEDFAKWLADQLPDSPFPDAKVK